MKKNKNIKTKNFNERRVVKKIWYLATDKKWDRARYNEEKGEKIIVEV